MVERKGTKMKKWLLWLLALVCLTASVAVAEETEKSAIEGSNAETLITALKSFGLEEAKEPYKVGVQTKWEGEYDAGEDASCSATVFSYDSGRIASASFEMRGKDVGLFGHVVKSLDYTLGNKAVAESYLKTAMKEMEKNKGQDSQEKTFTIGDVLFTLRQTTSISVAGIYINGRAISESRSEVKTYTMKVEHTDDIVEMSNLLKVIRDVKVRTEADMGSKCLGTAKKDEILTVLTPFYNKDWHQVTYNGEVAYVWAGYCELLQN